MAPTQTISYRDTLALFVPANFHITDSFFADLNLDSLEDALIVIQADTFIPETDNQKEDPARTMIILLRQKDKRLKTEAVNEYILSGVPCGGMMATQYFFPQLRVNKDASFGIYNFTYSCNNSAFESSLEFRYDPVQKHWLLDSYQYEDQSQTKEDAEKKENSFMKIRKDFGLLRFDEFDGEEESSIHGL